MTNPRKSFVWRKASRLNCPKNATKFLQERLGNLEPKCYEAVKSYTKVEAKNFHLNVALVTACQGVIEEKCSETVSSTFRFAMRI
jgi:hypothetical protein